MELYDTEINEVEAGVLDTGLGARVGGPSDAELAELEASLDRSGRVSEAALEETFTVSEEIQLLREVLEGVE